jgi:CDGSH iron-sulfur domain-containing protein 3
MDGERIDERVDDIEEIGANHSSICKNCKLSTLVPEVAMYGPYNRKHLEYGKKYQWCSCGKSANQPFCDGSHRGTAFRPVTFVAQDQVLHSLCGCKFTRSPPYCDGIHSVLYDVTVPPCKCPTTTTTIKL